MIGFGALVVDAGRAFTLQTELQKAADAAALTGAAELDLTPTSINRAREAAKSALITNLQTFASGGKDVVIEDSDIRFLSSLPADDDTPIPASSVTTDPLQAHYIQVTPSIREVDYLLGPVLAAFYGNEGDQLSKGRATATAVAGLQTYVCNFPPVMICNPAEASQGAGAAYEPVPGELVVLKQGGGDGQWTSGNFGLLDPPTGNQGTANVIENLASAEAEGCFTSPIDLRTGSATNPVSTAINVRFDMYENPGFGGGNDKNNPDYRPATIVTKGKYLSGGSFVDYGASPPPGSRAMPKHACLAAGNCATATGSGHPRFARMPTGDAAQKAFWADYWDTNHPDKTWETARDTEGLDANGDGIISRKEMYDWENNTGKIPTGDTDGSGAVTSEDEDDPSSPTGENGRPMNYGGSASALPEAKRREIYVAVINCEENGPLNGNTDNVPVLGYARMFLTHPAEGGSEQTIYAEVLELLEPDTNTGVVHDNVQLYR